MVDAFRSRDLRVGFYHSLIDWHHPHYVLDPHIGPYRAHPDREKMNRKRNQMKYADYLHGQVRELLTVAAPELLDAVTVTTDTRVLRITERGQ